MLLYFLCIFLFCLYVLFVCVCFVIKRLQFVCVCVNLIFFDVLIVMCYNVNAYNYRWSQLHTKQQKLLIAQCIEHFNT